VTRGGEPIYDKFSEIALNVIMGPYHIFHDKYPYKAMPDKGDITSVMKRYEKYKDNLQIVFGNQWKMNVGGRKVDRALWTYGHLFR
jgi:hypothetical protein